MTWRRGLELLMLALIALSLGAGLVEAVGPGPCDCYSEGDGRPSSNPDCEDNMSPISPPPPSNEQGGGGGGSPEPGPTIEAEAEEASAWGVMAAGIREAYKRKGESDGIRP